MSTATLSRNHQMPVTTISSCAIFTTRSLLPGDGAIGIWPVFSSTFKVVRSYGFVPVTLGHPARHCSHWASARCRAPACWHQTRAQVAPPSCIIDDPLLATGWAMKHRGRRRNDCPLAILGSSDHVIRWVPKPLSASTKPWDRRNSSCIPGRSFALMALLCTLLLSTMSWSA